MKKIYTSRHKHGSWFLFLLVLLIASPGYGQESICGPIVEDFTATGGSTAGFTGSFVYGTDGTRHFLVHDRVLASGIYTITTPTYQLANNAVSIGFGFRVDGTQKVSRISAKLMFVSTLNNELVTIQLEQIIPTFPTNTDFADICRTLSLSELPGFPTGGKYRFQFDLVSNSGAGLPGETMTFTNFRTNGTLSQIPLPVNFMGITAKRVNNATLVSWKVAGEENVVRYDVEKSSEGRHFTVIGSIQKTGRDDYSFTDVNSTGTVYYRVKNVDADGQFKYSTIVKLVNGKSELVLKAFPQPAPDQITVQHPQVGNGSSISITAMDGRTIRTVVPASGSIQTRLRLDGLAKGLYLLRFTDSEGTVQIIKLVKQ